MAKKELSRTLNKIRTPLNLVNTLLVDGLPFGILAQFFGATRCGKSTVALQTAEYFLQDYEYGFVDIIDSEGNYTTSSRLEKVFNLHPSNSELETVKQDPRVSFYRMATIEGVFSKITALANESAETKIPRLVIVDSISALSASALVEDINKLADKGKDSNPFAAGQSANSAIMTKLLGPLTDVVAKGWITVIFINQVTVDRNTYGNPEIAKGGPNARATSYSNV